MGKLIERPAVEDLWIIVLLVGAIVLYHQNRISIESYSQRSHTFEEHKPGSVSALHGFVRYAPQHIIPISAKPLRSTEGFTILQLERDVIIAIHPRKLCTACPALRIVFHVRGETILHTQAVSPLLSTKSYGEQNTNIEALSGLTLRDAVKSLSKYVPIDDARVHREYFINILTDLIDTFEASKGTEP